MPVNRVLSNVLAVLGGAALATASAALAQEQITTNDGLALQLLADGRISGVTVDGKLLPVGKTPGGFFIADVEQTLAEQPNLLLNPSGEADEDGDTKPDSWTLGGDWAWDEQVAHTGQRSFRATLPQTDEPRASGALTYPRMRVEPSTNYTLSIAPSSSPTWIWAWSSSSGTLRACSRCQSISAACPITNSSATGGCAGKGRRPRPASSVICTAA